MKLKEIKNPTIMNLEEVTNLFKRWFSEGISKEEGYVLWSIFSNNNRYLYVPTNQIIETGTMRRFGDFLSDMCNEKSNYLNFYMSDYKLDYMDTDVIKRVHRIVNPEIEYIEDYWNKEDRKIRDKLYTHQK